MCCAVGYGFGSHGLLASFHKSYLPPIGRAACAALLKRHDINLTNPDNFNELTKSNHEIVFIITTYWSLLARDAGMGMGANRLK
jgi:hypothetical protein